MKKFYNYIRHLQLINWHICRYSLKVLYAQKQGDFFFPNINLKKLTDLLKEFPEADMGGYEYDCCVEYLKKIRTTLFTHGFQVTYKLEFEDQDDLTLYPINNCLVTVARQCGFKVVISQDISQNVIYILYIAFFNKENTYDRDNF